MTASTPSLKTVFGFINRHGKDEYPAPLITVVENDGEFYRVYPSGEVRLYIDKATGMPASAEEIVKNDEFLESNSPHQLTEFSALTSFGIAAGNIVVGTVRQVFEAIEIEIDRDQHTGESLQRLIVAHHEWEKFLETPPTPE